VDRLGVVLGWKREVGRVSLRLWSWEISDKNRLTRSVDGKADQRFLARVDKVVLGSLRDDDQVTGVDHLLLSGDDGLALTLREDQVLVDVVNLQRQSRSDHVI
jgi:hypothetical protein